MSGIWNSTLQIQVLEDTDEERKEGRGRKCQLESFNDGCLGHCAKKDPEAIFGFNRIEFGDLLVTSTKGGRERGKQV